MQLWEIAAGLGVAVTIIFYMRHLPYNLPALAMIARMFPDTPIVIDHLGAPHQPLSYLHRTLSDGLGPLPYPGPPKYGLSAAHKDLRDHPNIHFKFTGINLEYFAHHGIDTQAFIRYFVTTYGASRLMCGSDIGQTVGPYSRIIAELRASMALLTPEERSAVLFDNANRIFGRALTKQPLSS
jgi:predicted TIM-barrel fold metal-dependent hydrolase